MLEIEPLGCKTKKIPPPKHDFGGGMNKRDLKPAHLRSGQVDFSKQ